MNEAATRSDEEQHDRAAGFSSIRPPLDPARLRRRQLSHDIHHELGTITLLAALLGNARDIGPDSRGRAELILRELSWLEQLLQAYEHSQQDRAEASGPGPEATRLDLVAAEVVGAIGLSCTTRLELRADALTAHVDPLAYWRALRNLVHNAVRAAGPTGTVAVRLTGESGWTLTDIDDDGPGFAARPPHSLGLGIVQDLVAASGGSMHLGGSAMGGAWVRLRLPLAATGGPGGTVSGLVA